MSPIHRRVVSKNVRRALIGELDAVAGKLPAGPGDERWTVWDFAALLFAIAGKLGERQ